MKKPIELSVEILKGIRTDLKKLREHTDAGFAQLDHRIFGLDGRLVGLEQRIVESETRTASAITDLAGTVREMTSVLRAQADLRPRVEKCELEIADIKRKLPQAS